MVLIGSRNIGDLLATAPAIDGFDAEPWTTPGVEILQATWEIDDADREALLPRALHPTIPPACIFTVAHYPEGPVGPFLLAQVRVSCRAAALPRGFLLRACVSTDAAAEALARRWGYACERGDVRLSRFHDRIVGAVTTNDGREVLRVSLIDPEPISGGDIQYVANMNLCTNGGEPVLVQVDPEYTFHRAERGRPQLDLFDRPAWRAEGVDPVWPMAASFATCDSGFPKVRYVLDPAKPAIEGTTRIG